MSKETQKSSPKLIGIMPTCGRHQILGQTLRAIARQSRKPDLIVIVDNEASRETQCVIEAFSCESESFDVKLVHSSENLGSAGGWALAIESIVSELMPEDWFVTLDDDDPPLFDDELEKVFSFAVSHKEADPLIAAVGIVGARFNWKTGFLKRLEDQDIQDATEVDYVGNNNLAMYSVGVVQDRGGFRSELFFGHTEVDYCLRLRSYGYRILANGDLWLRRRRTQGRLGMTVAPSRLCSDRWKKYYTVRNYIFIMLDFGRIDLALKQAFIQVVMKPLVTLPRNPGLAFRGFLLAVRAAFDGFTGRMGKTLTPEGFEAKRRP